MIEISSLHLKTGLLAYFRYKRQSLCGEEVSFGLSIADVLVDTGTSVVEIETKISKSDLKADSNKPKHEFYKKLQPNNYCCPNLFYICVPTYLVEDAKLWVESINPKYGIIEFSEVKYEQNKQYSRHWDKMLYFIKKAKPLKSEYKTYKKSISLRLNSSLINRYIELIHGIENRETYEVRYPNDA